MIGLLFEVGHPTHPFYASQTSPFQRINVTPGLPSQDLCLRVRSALVRSVEVLSCLTCVLESLKRNRLDFALRHFIAFVRVNHRQRDLLASCMRICLQLYMIPFLSELDSSPETYSGFSFP